jgi:hypothetical protein
MYRYVATEQSPPILNIGNLLGEKYPKAFKPASPIRPHVSILAKGAVFYYFRDDDADNPKEFARQVRRQAHSDLMPGADQEVLAKCISIDFVGRGASLGIFLESDQLSDETEHSYELLEAALGRRIHTDRRPHISLGKLLYEPRPAFANRVLDSTSELCASLLPPERELYLGAISFENFFTNRRDIEAARPPEFVELDQVVL